VSNCAQSKLSDQCKEKARLKLEQLLMEEHYAVRKSAITGMPLRLL
jgi:hypothetical protein